MTTATCLLCSLERPTCVYEVDAIPVNICHACARGTDATDFRKCVRYARRVARLREEREKAMADA